ncbi:MAG TPA: phosphatidylserine decarboxylase [Stellaceae bacterium]|jgi:phosphatidylserine decarboxylase|nr:phosphatidylserine decarboxylase [Stellaceae bacterium]
MTHPDRFGAWRAVLPPIHPDGWPFIAIAVVVTIILFVIWQPLGWLALIASLWVAAFFRDPWRVSPQAAGLALAPADGEIVVVDRAPPPAELGIGAMPMVRVEIFLSLLDVHMNRMPLAGKITKMVYRKGGFRDARDTLAGAENERNAIALDTRDGAAALVQIAGRVARRIRCDLTEGQEVIAGQRFGLIRFGSRAAIYLPAHYVPLVHEGQRAVAGETVIAAAPGAALAPREGFVTQ